MAFLALSTISMVSSNYVTMKRRETYSIVICVEKLTKQVRGKT